MSICSECGCGYATKAEARYCRGADLDPRRENDLIRRGEIAPVLPTRWTA